MTSFINSNKYKIEIENPPLAEFVIDASVTDEERASRIQKLIESYRDKLNVISRN